MKYDVSVVVLTYNAKWEKLRGTLESVLIQKGLEYEIIIADDGSSVRWDREICEFCDRYGFSNLKIVNAPQNGGTVRNLSNGVKESNGDYIKPIAAGDYLYDQYTLVKWFDFMKQNNAKISFGNAVYFFEESNEIKVLKKVNHPMQLSLYDDNVDSRAFFVNYLIANDTVLGAALMTEQSVMRHYLGEIVGKVKFAEDYMVRLAVFDGVVPMHCPINVIWYEYGIGVSTAASEKWRQILLQDYYATNEIIAKRSKYNNKYAELLSKVLRKKGIKQKIAKAICFPDYILARRKNKKHPSFTPEKGNTEVLISFMKGKNDAGDKS